MVTAQRKQNAEISKQTDTSKERKAERSNIISLLLSVCFDLFALCPSSRHSSRREAGQATSEFLLMLFLMTAIGIFIMETMAGQFHSAGGAANAMSQKAVDSIAKDEKR